jgi:hypothetical protein
MKRLRGNVRGMCWRATSAKRIYLNVVSNKSGKYVGAILRVVFECLPSVIMAKM